MDVLFFVMFVLSGVTMLLMVPIGFFKKDKKKTRMGGIAGLLAFVGLVGFLITLDPIEEEVEEENVVEKTTRPKTNYSAKQKENSQEKQNEGSTSKDAISKVVKDILGDRLVEVEYMDATDHYNVYAEAAGLSANMDRKSTYFDTSKILEKIQGEEFGSLYFEYQANFVDDFGDSEQRKGITYNLTKETVDKINFDSFLPEKLPDIADSYWQHPAFN